jgi:hypothetical protein
MTMEKRYPLFRRERFFWEWREMYRSRYNEWFGTLTSGPHGDRANFECMDRRVRRYSGCRLLHDLSFGRKSSCPFLVTRKAQPQQGT